MKITKYDIFDAIFFICVISLIMFSMQYALSGRGV
jgi:hypothetical protein